MKKEYNISEKTFYKINMEGSHYEIGKQLGKLVKQGRHLQDNLKEK